MSQRFNVPITGVCLFIFSALSSTGCDVGRSVLAPLDASVADVPVADVPAVDAPAVDAPAVDAPAVDAPAVDAPPVDAPVADVPAVDSPVADVPAVDAPAVDAPAPTLGCQQGVECVRRCPFRDAACFRACSAQLRPASAALFDPLVTCAVTACGTDISSMCVEAVGGSTTGACHALALSCLPDSAGTYAPPCADPNQSRCGAACVNTLIDNANCGLCGRACTAAQVCELGACVTRGHTDIVLTWNGVGDIDLVVSTPCGDSISARHASACGTFGASNSTGFGPENISFPAAPMAGHYNLCGVPRTAFAAAPDDSAVRATVFRTGMPTVSYPTPNAHGPNDRAERDFYAGAVVSLVPSTTVDTCDPAGPYFIAGIDL